MNQTITFFGGLNTIGGTNVMVGCGDTAIVFDLGRMPTGFFFWHTDGIAPMGDKALRQYLLGRDAIPLPHLYHPRFLGDLTVDEIASVWDGHPFPYYPNLCAFVSHIHRDHMDFLPFISDRVPVYMHRDALSVYRGAVAGSLFPSTQAPLEGLRDSQPVTLADGFTIEVMELDHDTPGSSGLLIRTPDSVIFYTGDFRFHGRHADRVHNKMMALAKESVSLLLTEGTTLSYDSVGKAIRPTHETEVTLHFDQMLSSANGLAYLNIMPHNLERLAELIMVTKKHGRKLVLSRALGLLWSTAITKGISALAGHPAVNDAETVVVLDDEAGKILINLPYGKVLLRDIVENKKGYAVFLPQEQLSLMIELERLGEQVHSVYFHADGFPLGDDDTTLRYWLRELEVSYHYHQAGGHATPDMLTQFVQAVQPRAVVPLHSANPSLLNSGSIPKILPYYGQTFDLTSFKHA